MKRIMVTGINGFVGKHLLHELVASGHRVIGVGIEAEPQPQVKAKVDSYLVCDLTSPSDVAKLPLEDVQAVINLAGLAQVGASFQNPELYTKVNVGVLKVLGQELLTRSLPIRLIAISTGAVYASSQPMPLTEDSLLITDGSPYALSKLAMEQTAAELREGGLDCVVVRPFNHIGPGQEAGFLVPDLYSKIRASLKSGAPILVGNLATKRDYTDVRDVVRAYVALATAKHLSFDTYNICCGQSFSGQTVLDSLLRHLPQASKITVQRDPHLIRSNDPADLYGSHDRLSHDTGWQPLRDFEQTIADFVAASGV